MDRQRRADATRGGIALAIALALAASTVTAQARSTDEDATDDGSSFLFVPYPITEPTVGNGLLAGPVWMRAGPPEPSGPASPQAYGVGALWTDGGSRGVIAFDHRAWAGGRWRTTATAGTFDLRLAYTGVRPGGDDERHFDLSADGAMLSAERRLGAGPGKLGLRAFGSHAAVHFRDAEPVELLEDATRADINGVAAWWARDTRDDEYTPRRGQSVQLRGTAYAPALGASFEATELKLDWTGYRPLGRGAIGARAIAASMHGDAPFHLRPYLAFRGLPALRYAGERVASLEAELRWPVGRHLHALAFAGTGTARADTRGVRGSTTASAGGAGVRWRAEKYFGMTFGVDVARGPDGTVGYVQIGNAWSR